MAVPNVSEGRDPAAIAAIGAAFAPATLLDTHSDPDHGRSVFTLAGRQGDLAAALVDGAREATARIDLTTHTGDHPHVGAIDVVPVVHLDDETRGAACAEALTAGGLIAEELGLPVFLYGPLGSGRERAEIRRGGRAELARRIHARETTPDFGPAELDPRRGAVLVAARPPLVAFNVDLASDDLGLARRIAAELRESAPGGLPGVRAIGLRLPHRGCAQVSTNVHDHTQASLAHIVERIAARAPIRAAEIVGLAPAAALEGFPADVRLSHSGTIENALGSLPGHGPDEEEASA
jgi:glutamate formiminotransferase